MSSETAREIVERYWQAMNANDWRAASELLYDDYVLDYPQSGERFRGRDHFIALNAEYPAAGPWRFTVHRIVAGEQGVASDVSVTDGAITARVVSFFELRDGKIWRMTEFWPDPFAAPGWRALLSEPAMPEPGES